MWFALHFLYPNSFSQDKDTIQHRFKKKRVDFWFPVLKMNFKNSLHIVKLSQKKKHSLQRQQFTEEMGFHKLQCNENGRFGNIASCIICEAQAKNVLLKYQNTKVSFHSLSQNFSWSRKFFISYLMFFIIILTKQKLKLQIINLDFIVHFILYCPIPYCCSIICIYIGATILFHTINERSLTLSNSYFRVYVCICVSFLPEQRKHYVTD